jgi:hypothetical protein
MHIGGAVTRGAEPSSGGQVVASPQFAGRKAGRFFRSTPVVRSWSWTRVVVLLADCVPWFAPNTPATTASSRTAPTMAITAGGGASCAAVRPFVPAGGPALDLAGCDSWPSGVERDTNSAPIIVVAPGRFSTTTCRPRCSESLGAMRRAVMSVPPPGVEATTRRTGRVG